MPDITPGDLYWVPTPSARDTERLIAHPHLILSVSSGPTTALNTLTACCLTSNLHRVSLPGSVLLEAGEANLTKPSVIEVSKCITITQHELGDYIGSISAERLEQVLAGMRFVTHFIQRKP